MNSDIFYGKTTYMKTLFLIKNPDLFQGERYLRKSKSYFEGWYFKNTNKEQGISFIPGINIEKNIPKAFVQVITNDTSYFINYDIDKFEFAHEPFVIRVGNNIFTKEGIHIDVNTEDVNIKGDIKYSENENIDTNFMNPNIMGPFSYIPFMECNHAILSMKNKTNGSINVNGSEIKFEDDMGYIEKDWGCSFPKTYIWCQGNNFQKTNASFMLSIADVPFKMFKFRGVICALIIEDKEYKFTTYNNAKLIECDVNDSSLNITLKKGDFILNLKSVYDKGHKLSAPVKGKMDKDIFESITSQITVTLKNGNNVIFSDTSKNCGLEIVK